MNNLKKLIPAAMLAGGLVATGAAQAGATVKIDDTKWASFGVGLRTSFKGIEDQAGSRNSPGTNEKWSTDFNIDNIRLYLNGQVHKYVKLEFNTECTNCSSGGDIIVLDAIGKFEITDYFNVWVGRQLVAADRAELNGPFYHSTYEFNKTPFYPADFGNQDAGRFGRDDGVQVWGSLLDKGQLTYVAGVFDGLEGGANADDTFLYAGRVSYNFWDVEQNPGYYTSSTYYGKGGDILTLAVAGQYQEDGAGTRADPGDFWGASADLLMEKVLSDDSVVTVEGEYKYFSLDGLSQATLNDADCFCLFEGKAYTGTVLYLFPQEVGIGKLQPYARYTRNIPDNSTNRFEVEGGLNYVIDGHNARVSIFYQYGDIATKGRNYAPGRQGENVSAVGVGVQIQI